MFNAYRRPKRYARAVEISGKSFKTTTCSNTTAMFTTSGDGPWVSSSKTHRMAIDTPFAPSSLSLHVLNSLFGSSQRNKGRPFKAVVLL